MLRLELVETDVAVKLKHCLSEVALLLNKLVDLDEDLRAQRDLLYDFVFHSDVMVLVISKQCAVRADALLVVHADYLKLSFVQWAHVSPRGHRVCRRILLNELK